MSVPLLILPSRIKKAVQFQNIQGTLIRQLRHLSHLNMALYRNNTNASVDSKRNYELGFLILSAKEV
jgi:hypothetical protein